MGVLERVIVAVDVRHLVHLQTGGTGYASAVEALLCKVLETGSKDTIWAFKFFDSSLSSFASTSRIRSWLGKMATGSHYALSQDKVNLTAFRNCIEKIITQECCSSGESRAEHVVRALQEVLTDFSWDPLLVEDEGEEQDDSIWARARCSNLVLLLSSVPLVSSPDFLSFLNLTAWTGTSEQDSADIFAVKFRPVCSHLDRRNIHACWIQPPGHHRVFSGSIYKGLVRRLGSWSLTSIDTILLSAFYLPPTLVLPYMALHAAHWLPDCNQSPVHAKLQVSIRDKRHFMCEVDMASLPPSHGSQPRTLLLDGCTKIRVTVAALVPKKFIRRSKLQNAESYVVYQHSSRAEAGVEDDTDTLPVFKRQLLERLKQHLPHRMVSRRSELQLLLLDMARRDAAALVNIDMMDMRSQTRRSLRGILDPLTVYFASLRIQEEIGREWFTDTSLSLLKSENGLTKRKVSFPVAPAAKRSKPWNTGATMLLECSNMDADRSDLLDADTWGAAWAQFLDLLQNTHSKDTLEVFFINTNIACSKLLRSWNKQVDRHLLTDICRWLRIEVPQPAEITHPHFNPHELPTPVVRNKNLIPTDKASFYLRKLNSGMDSGNLELQIFAKRIVADTAAAFKATSSEDSGNVFTQLKNKLLQSPRSLYRRDEHERMPKIEEYVLQIKLRLEIIAADLIDGPEAQTELIEQICELLSRIQFTLPGGVFEMEDLKDFADRVIQSGYKDVLPSVVDNIYLRMEFKGYFEGAADGGSAGFDKALILVPQKEEEQTVPKITKAAANRGNAHFSGRAQKLRVSSKPQTCKKTKAFVGSCLGVYKPSDVH